MYKLLCAGTAVSLYIVMTKEREDPYMYAKVGVKQQTMYSEKSQVMDDYSKEQLGDLSLEELDKHIADLQNKRGRN